jgi:hypothetical protein
MHLGFTNFMLKDSITLVAAAAAMPLFLVIPGYGLGWLSNLFDFRERRQVTRFLIGIVLSVAIFPAATFLLSRFSSFDAALYSYSVFWALFVWILVKERRRIRIALDPWTRTAAALTLAWVLAALVSLPDLQLDRQVYANVVINDHSTRIALTDAIYRTGIPPANPHIFPGRPLPVSYFYFWYIFPALLSRLAGGLIDPRIAFYAGIVWVGIAARAAACLNLRFVSPEAGLAIGPRAAAAVGLFFVTGLDVIFAAIHIAYLPGSPSPFVTEWWNGNSQVTAWAGAALWVPHHLAGLVAGITGILIFQDLSRATSPHRKAALAVLAAFSLASLVGLSVYVGLVFAVYWAARFCLSLAWKQWRPGAPWMAAAGCFTLLLVLPFLRDLLANRASFSTQTQGGLLVFEVRSFGFLAWVTNGRAAWLQNLFNLLLLPVNYFLELGFFFVAGLLYLQAAARERRAYREGRTPKDGRSLFDHLGTDLLLLACSGFICSFFRSAIIGNNDVGWRGFLPVQFILLVWGANVIVTTWPGWAGRQREEAAPGFPIVKKAAVVLLVIGLASTLFDLAYLRVYAKLDDRLGWSNRIYGAQVEQRGRRAYALREGYQYVYAAFPLDAILQSNPEVEYLVLAQGVYGQRQTAAAGREYAFIYGDTPDVYQAVSGRILPVFNDPTLGWPAVARACQDAAIDVLLVKDLDPVWQDAGSWVWSRAPAFWNDFVRVYACDE